MDNIIQSESVSLGSLSWCVALGCLLTDAGEVFCGSLRLALFFDDEGVLVEACECDGVSTVPVEACGCGGGSSSGIFST